MKILLPLTRRAKNGAFTRLPSHRDGAGAFTLVELLVVLGAVVLLGCLTLRGTSLSASVSQTVQCMQNVEQLTRAWTIYAVDNQGWLPPNSDNGAYGNWVGGNMSGSGTFHDPTNYGLINNTYPKSTGPYNDQASLIGNFLENYKVAKCPADPSWFGAGGLSFGKGWGPRVRSYSMNAGVGTQPNVQAAVTGPWLTGSYGANHPGNPFNTYGKLNSFTNPGPANTFVLVDEDPYSINDGALSVDCNLPDELIDFPASLHDHGAVFSFADGHVILKHWMDPRTYYLSTSGGMFNGNQPSNPDIEWLRLHSSAYGNGQPLKLSTTPSP